MKTIFWSMMACGGMRYNACSTVHIGDSCSKEDLDVLECTKRPPVTVDNDCYEYVTEDHDIARCTKVGEEYIWSYHDSCTGGLYAITNGTDFDCIQGTVYDCNDEIVWDSDD
jgi:hypothetical protein